MINSASIQQWFVFRVTYGREGKACEIIRQEGVRAYLPQKREKVVIGRVTRTLQKPLIPNLLFVYCSPTQADHLVKKHHTLPKFIRYYFNHLILNPDGTNPPLIVPEHEMSNFIRLTSVDSDHIRVVDPAKCHFRDGDLVRVTQGAFEGVVGRVARFAGQQRVVIVLEGLCAVATAYVPSAFLEPENSTRKM